MYNSNKAEFNNTKFHNGKSSADAGLMGGIFVNKFYFNFCIVKNMSAFQYGGTFFLQTDNLLMSIFRLN